MDITFALNDWCDMATVSGEKLGYTQIAREHLIGILEGSLVAEPIAITPAILAANGWTGEEQPGNCVMYKNKNTDTIRIEHVNGRWCLMSKHYDVLRMDLKYVHVLQQALRIAEEYQLADTFMPNINE